MRETLELINQMQSDGVIGKYAIGGAVGATFYLPPSATIDLDIFVELPKSSGSSLLTLTPIYEYLTARGCAVRHEHIVIGKWPVQFLSPSNPLEKDAIENAIPTDVNGVPTWVMRAEHLVAIALKTGRTKDHARILQFLDQKAVNQTLLTTLLVRHQLPAKWKEFGRRYLSESR